VFLQRARKLQKTGQISFALLQQGAKESERAKRGLCSSDAAKSQSQQHVTNRYSETQNGKAS
jgi:hypothetical protein